VGLIHFSVPGQPIGKGRPRVGKRGNHAIMFTPAKTVSYENLVKHAAFEAMAGAALIEGPVRAVVHMACQIPASWSWKRSAQAMRHEIRPTTKPDIDNVLKAIFDAINGVVWKDDVQVCDCQIRKYYSDSPCVKVWIGELTPVEAMAI
jgi:Holliday junction resolvase RusA-like endonuclease